MPDTSVKSRIVDALIALPKPLIAEGRFRKVERKRSVYLLEPIKPAIHGIDGPERVLGEDSRGYTLEFDWFYKIILPPGRDPYALGDQAEQFIQAKVEQDPQLFGTPPTPQPLVARVTYRGNEPFVEEELKEEGGAILMYTIQYRRFRNDPTQNY